MNWTEWNEKIGGKIVDRAFAIAKREGEPHDVLQLEALIRRARKELSQEAGIDPYEDVTLDCTCAGHCTQESAGVCLCVCHCP